jgi:hypothetical protein
MGSLKLCFVSDIPGKAMMKMFPALSAFIFSEENIWGQSFISEKSNKKKFRVLQQPRGPRANRAATADTSSYSWNGCR